MKKHIIMRKTSYKYMFTFKNNKRKNIYIKMKEELY